MLFCLFLSTLQTRLRYFFNFYYMCVLVGSVAHLGAVRGHWAPQLSWLSQCTWVTADGAACFSHTGTCISIVPDYLCRAKHTQKGLLSQLCQGNSYISVYFKMTLHWRRFTDVWVKTSDMIKKALSYCVYRVSENCNKVQTLSKSTIGLWSSDQSHLYVIDEHPIPDLVHYLVL